MWGKDGLDGQTRQAASIGLATRFSTLAATTREAKLAPAIIRLQRQHGVALSCCEAGVFASAFHGTGNDVSGPRFLRRPKTSAQY